MKPTLVIFAKNPRIGRVKTRLAAGIGHVRACAFYRQNLAALVRRVGHDRRWQTLVAITPDDARPIETMGVEHVSQGGGNLGDRMQRAFNTLPPGPVVIIGSDIPDVQPRDIAAAFATLGRHDAVMGPSADGGYWLIGLKRSPRIPRVLDDVRWSVGETGGDTRSRLKAQGCSLGLVRELNDVDTVEDLRVAT